MLDKHINLEKSLIILHKKMFMASACLLLSMFIFSRLSWSFLFSNITWTIILIMSLFLLSFSTRKIKFNLFKTDNVAWLYIIVLLIILFFNNYDIKNKNWNPVFIYIIGFLFFTLLTNREKWFKYFLNFSMIFSLFFMLMTIYCEIHPGYYYNNVVPLMKVFNTSYRPSPEAGFTAHASTNGMYLSIGIIGTFSKIRYSYKKNNKKEKIFNILISFLLIITLLTTGKRGQVICLIFAYVVTYYLFNPKKKGKLIRLIIIFMTGFLLLLVLSHVIPQVLNVIDRFRQTISEGNVSSNRFMMWREAFDKFCENPLLGCGWRWFKYNNHVERNGDAHNVYLQLLLEVGIIGSIPFFFFFGIFIKRIVLLCRMDNYTNKINEDDKYFELSFCCLYQIYFLAYSFEGTTLYDASLFYIYLITCSVINKYWRKYRVSNDNLSLISLLK